MKKLIDFIHLLSLSVVLDRQSYSSRRAHCKTAMLTQIRWYRVPTILVTVLVTVANIPHTSITTDRTAKWPNPLYS